MGFEDFKKKHEEDLYKKFLKEEEAKKKEKEAKAKEVERLAEIEKARIAEKIRLEDEAREADQWRDVFTVLCELPSGAGQRSVIQQHRKNKTIRSIPKG